MRVTFLYMYCFTNLLTEIPDPDSSQSDVTAVVTGGGVVAVVVVLIIAGTNIVIVVLVLRYHRRGTPSGTQRE